MYAAKDKANYLNNKRLKAPNVQIQFTEEQMEEVIKCSQDPIYFVKNYVKIVNPDRGLIPFDMYSYQEKMLSIIHNNRYTVGLWPRQSGKTVTYVGYILWFIIFNADKNVAILANRSKTAKSILSKVKRAYEHIPLWMQQGVTEWNKTSVELENGSKVIADSTSANSIRGETQNMILLDEFAFVHRNVAEEFFASVYPTISASEEAKVVIVSTANGVNLFYKIWTEAIKKENKYVPFSIHWSDVPGRDAKWKEETIKNIGEQAFKTEFENEFFGSGSNTLISSTKLRSLMFDQPIYSSDGLDIYEHEEKDSNYMICVDSAEGASQDYHAFTVIKISKFPYQVVAKFRSNTISVMTFPNVVVDVAKKYNDSLLLIELNSTGSQVVDIIKYDLEYEHILATTTDKKLSSVKLGLGEGKKYRFGVRMLKNVKNIGCANLRALVENDKLIIKDFDIISELTTFVSNGISYEAEKGAKDDLAMSLVMFSWLSCQKYFKELTDQSIRDVLSEEKKIVIPVLVFNSHDDATQESFVEDGDLWVVQDEITNEDLQDMVTDIDDIYRVNGSNYKR